MKVAVASEGFVTTKTITNASIDSLCLHLNPYIHPIPSMGGGMARSWEKLDHHRFDECRAPSPIRFTPNIWYLNRVLE